MRPNSRNTLHTDSLAQNLKFQSHDNYEATTSLKDTTINAKNLDNKSKNNVILYNNTTYLSTLVYFMLLF